MYCCCCYCYIIIFVAIIDTSISTNILNIIYIMGKMIKK